MSAVPSLSKRDRGVAVHCARERLDEIPAKPDLIIVEDVLDNMVDRGKAPRGFTAFVIIIFAAPTEMMDRKGASSVLKCVLASLSNYQALSCMIRYAANTCEYQWRYCLLLIDAQPARGAYLCQSAALPGDNTHGGVQVQANL